MKLERCPICHTDATALDVLDLNESNHDDDIHFALSGIPVYYYLCPSCRFCFAPMFQQWTSEQFTDNIYNEGYLKIDPGYGNGRPARNALRLIAAIPSRPAGFRHLDYGGGGGEMSTHLRVAGWDSTNFDLYNPDSDTPIQERGQFDLITAYEVMEHVPDPQGVLSDIKLALKPGGVFLFSTLVHEGKIVEKSRITWWYAGPRAGHISLFSKESLRILAASHDFNLKSRTNAEHAMCIGNFPDWVSDYPWECVR